MKFLPSMLMVLAVAGAALPAAHAVDTSPAPAPAADRLGPAKAHIAQGRWRDAIAALQQVGDRGSADWNNLMGYAHRKQATPDLAAAESYYDAALRIDPQHRGALEYSGELYLMRNDLPRAEERLATLDKTCRSCEEQKDLRAAIVAYKAAGNRYVAKP